MLQMIFLSRILTTIFVVGSILIIISLSLFSLAMIDQRTAVYSIISIAVVLIGAIMSGKYFSADARKAAAGSKGEKVDTSTHPEEAKTADKPSQPGILSPSEAREWLDDFLVEQQGEDNE